jgi:hypothetical protein
MDFDNFEFKPLTGGLGFDKKAEEARPQRKENTTRFDQDFTPAPIKKEADLESTKTSTVSRATSQEAGKEKLKNSIELFERSLERESNQDSSRTIKDMLNSLPPSMDFVEAKPASTNRNYNPVGRTDYSINKKLVDPLPEAPSIDLLKNNSMDITLDNTLEKAFPKVGFRKPFFHQTVEIKPQFTPVTASFTSSVIDALVISGLTALFLVSLIVFTKVDLIAVILHTQAPLSVWLEIGGIFMGVYLLYYMCTRGFWGSTLGDWAFDIQLGMEQDRLKWYYPGLVVLRMMVVALTGFFILPLASFIAKTDLAGKISGIRLYAKNY